MTLRDVFSAALRLPIGDLCALLGPVEEHADGTLTHACPRGCPARLMSAWTDRALVWRCRRCHQSGTGFDVLDRVLHDPRAVQRLAELMHS